jgi:hypothetical protein
MDLVEAPDHPDNAIAVASFRGQIRNIHEEIKDLTTTIDQLDIPDPAIARSQAAASATEKRNTDDLRSAQRAASHATHFNDDVNPNDFWFDYQQLVFTSKLSKGASAMLLNLLVQKHSAGPIWYSTHILLVQETATYYDLKDRFSKNFSTLNGARSAMRS